MLPKHLYPHLNRQQRRHPNRNKEWVIPKGGANWLLAALLIRAGFWRMPDPMIYPGRDGQEFHRPRLGQALRAQVMLNPDSWREYTRNLEPGRSLRAAHDCGEGRTLLVSREGSTFKAYCFRCSDGGTIKGPEETLAAKVARLSALAQAEAKMQSAALPDPRVYAVADWPTEARLWFFKAGLSSADIGKLGAYYHPPSKRAVLPVLARSGGIDRAVFWQARALASGQVPKYMAPNVDKSKVLPRYGKADRITLTEDILSAYKVGLVGEGWCLMGTSLNANTLAKLMARRCAVNVWLDNDLPPAHRVNRGQIAAAKVGKQLRAMGLEVRNIIAPRDPKLMTREQIKEYIS